VTETMPAPVPAPAEARNCRWCGGDVIPCPFRSRGYVTRCRGWVHIPPAGREAGRHYCGISATSTQAAPGEPKRESDA
jgi:hypothetical protein